MVGSEEADGVGDGGRLKADGGIDDEAFGTAYTEVRVDEVDGERTHGGKGGSGRGDRGFGESIGRWCESCGQRECRRGGGGGRLCHSYK